MATGDLIMKLLLNSSDFDRRIGKSKAEVNQFGELGKRAMGGMGAALAKVAGAAGIALGSMELFNKAIASSQTLTDAFGRNIEVLKTGFDNFMYSIANADFSPMLDGLDEMARRAREAYDAYDQLANTQMSAQFVSALDQARYREAMVRARDKTLSREDREAALAEARALGAAISEAARKTEQDSFVALQKMFAAKAGADSSLFTPQMMEEAFRIDSRFASDKERAAIMGDYARYQARIQEIKKTHGRYDTVYGMYGTSSTRFSGFTEEGSRLVDEAQKSFSGVILKYIALMRLSDDELKKAMDTYVSAVNYRNAAAEIGTSTNEVGITMASEYAPKAGGAAAPKIAPKRQAPVLQGAGILGIGGGAAIDYAAMSAGLRTTADPTAEIERIAGILRKETAQIQFEEQQQEMEALMEGVDRLAGSFGNLGASIGGAAGNMLALVGNIAEAASTIIPFIALLHAEAVAHNANASAAMKEAAAKTLAQYSSIPFAGIALGAAAVAALVGVMQGLPKFAEGGIVSRPTLGLFGEAGPEAIMPLDKVKEIAGLEPRNIRVQGEIRGKGKDLIVVIDNYNKVRNVK